MLDLLSINDVGNDAVNNMEADNGEVDGEGGGVALVVNSCLTIEGR